LKALLIGQFIEPPFAEGGVNVILNWVKASHLAGVNITVLSLSSRFSGSRRIFGVDFEYIKTDKPRFQSNLIDSLPIQMAALKRLDFDIVHFASSIDGLSAIPVLSILKLQKHKIISSYLTNDCFSRFTPFFSNFMFHVVTVPSKRMFSSFIEKKIAPEKMILLPSCVDENYFCPRDKIEAREKLGLKEGYFIIFSVGHFRRGRLIIPLIKLINEMIGKGAKIQLIIGWTGQGEKDCIDEIFSMARKNQLIKIIPPTENINLYYNASDIYVLSAGSDYVIETPLSLLEAASSGVPALAFNINGSSEIIQDGQTGYIIKENNFDEMELKINQLKDNVQLLNEMSKNSRKLALSSFSYERTGPQLSNLYNKLADQS